nr:substrate-binding domain-containing protein [Anaerolinea sp.]
PPTAIFAANDMTAMGIYQVAHELGVRIPQDLSVVGFDNLHEAMFMNPPLTTVDQFMENMGTVATEMIVHLVDEERSVENLRVFQTQLVVRDSCTLPNQH